MASEATGTAEPVALPRSPSQLLTGWGEAMVFWRLRTETAKSLLRFGLREARVQVLSVAFAMFALWAGLFVMFFEGFYLIQTALVHEGMRAQLTQAIFNVFFLALTIMLIFSTGIILYGGLFRSSEVGHLLTTPTRCERIVWHKFQEAAFFSGWGFLLLSSPLLLAYGFVVGAPGYYYVMLIPFVISFVLIPAAIGSLICLLIVRLVPAVRVHAMAVIAILLLLICGVFGWRVLAYQNRDMMTMAWFQDVLARLQFSEQRLLPSWWLSTGLLEAAHPVKLADGRPAWLDSVMFLAVLTSNAWLLQILLGQFGGRVLRSSLSGLQGLKRARRRSNVGWFDRCVVWACGPLPGIMRHLLIKDLRLVRRDPVQWSQFGIFFGLLSLYFFNVRRFDYSGVMEKWVVLISFFNLAVVGLLLSTFTTRFIFPMISLEGRRFWVLGTAPIRRETILWGKFLFSCAGSIPACALLVLISDLALRIHHRSFVLLIVHQIACLVLAVGLSALAVGFGARLPNLREPSPSKIAAGFGGTLTLILSSLYIIAVLLLTVIPCFFWYGGALDKSYVSGPFFGGTFGLGSPGSIVLGVALALLLGVLTAVFSMRMGMRAFRDLEV
jgi:ABC-2 type transport system permease protein